MSSENWSLTFAPRVLPTRVESAGGQQLAEKELISSMLTAAECFVRLSLSGSGTFATSSPAKRTRFHSAKTSELRPAHRRITRYFQMLPWPGNPISESLETATAGYHSNRCVRYHYKKMWREVLTDENCLRLTLSHQYSGSMEIERNLWPSGCQSPPSPLGILRPPPSH